MPRTDGVSSSSRVLCILLRPKPINVCRCLAGRLIGDPICLTSIFLTISVFLYASTASESGASSRRRISATFLPRRWATILGDASFLNPSSVARIML